MTSIVTFFAILPVRSILFKFSSSLSLGVGDGSSLLVLGAGNESSLLFYVGDLSTFVCGRFSIMSLLLFGFPLGENSFSRLSLVGLLSVSF